ncbi:MAG TPA: hypothetical protein VGO93_10570 [Candidatus Xenobia bacterium]|jgi:hypothetical protein
MKHTVSALILALFLSLAPVSADTLSSTSPEGVCNDFMTAMQAHDWKKAYGYFTKTLQQQTPYERWMLTYDSLAPHFVMEHWKADLKESGDHARGKIELTSKYDGDESTSNTAVELVKENGEWRISEYK